MMLMHDQHLYKITAIEVYGRCRLLITIESVLLICFQSGVEKWLAWAAGD